MRFFRRKEGRKRSVEFSSRLNGEILKLIINNIGLSVLDKAVRFTVSFFVGAWVVRYLGPSSSGAISYSLANIAILTAVAKLGLDPLILRELSLRSKDPGVVLGTAFGLRFAAGVVLALFSISVLTAVNDASFFWIIAILSLTLLSQPLDALDLWFQSSGRLKKPIVAGFVSLAVTSSLRIYSVLSGAGVVVFAALQVLDNWVSYLAKYYFFRREQYLTLKFDGSLAREFLLEGWPYLISGLMVIFYMQIDQIMLGRLVDSRAVGIFSAATSLVAAAYFVPTVINISVLPFLTRTFRNNRLLYDDLTCVYINITLFFSTTISILMYFIAPFIITSLFGPQFESSIGVMRLYCWSYIFVCCGIAQSNWFVNSSSGRYLLTNTIFGAILNFCFNIVLIPKYGPQGAAIGTLIGYMGATYGALILFNRRLLYIQFILLFTAGFMSRILGRENSLN